MRRGGAALIVLALLGGAVAWTVPSAVETRFNRVTASSRRPAARATELHSTLRVVDLHADSLLWGRDLLSRGSRGQVDVPKLLAGNVALQAFTVVTSSLGDQGADKVRWLAMAQLWPPRTWTSLEARALHQAGLFDRYAARSQGRLQGVRSQADLRALLERREGGTQVVGGLLGLEGAHALGESSGSVERLHAAGFRMVGLAHFFDNEFAGSAHGERKHGLTGRGRELVAELERRQMLVDLAHSSPATIRDVLGMATRPVVVSHTGVRGTCDNERNLSDGQLRAIAANGGLVGIGYWRTAVCGDDAGAIARAMRHAVAQAGLEHVTLGSDFDGAVTTPFDAAGLAQLTEALLAAGFDQAQVRKLMGENALVLLARNLPAS